jgi:U3 small nucleolar RNA-associated protein 18
MPKRTRFRDLKSVAVDSALAYDARDAQLQKESDSEGFDDDGNESEDTDEDDNHVTVPKGRVMPDKDESEEELERLVFGDSAGFMQGVQDFLLDTDATHAAVAHTEKSEDESDREELADEELFFFDSGARVPTSAITTSTTAQDEPEKPAWNDSDDERMVVSLASVPRLRKLRETEEEDVVSGKEYVRRLRKEYQRLHPAPKWALQAMSKADKKRRQAADDGDTSENSFSDMELDGDDNLSTRPLAKLLKDADILARASRGAVKRRKLQSGTVNIHRLKDVAKKGPVGHPMLRRAIQLLMSL